MTFNLYNNAMGNTCMHVAMNMIFPLQLVDHQNNYTAVHKSFEKKKSPLPDARLELSFPLQCYHYCHGNRQVFKITKLQ